MKIVMAFLFMTQFLLSQSKIIFLHGLVLQLEKNKTEFLKEAKDIGFEIKDNGNGNYYINKEIDGTRNQANVRFIDEKLVSADKIWGVYLVSNSFVALRDYFNLLEKQKEDEQLNVVFTERATDINSEWFYITNSFGEYRVEIKFDKEKIIVTEELYKVLIK